MNPVVVTIVRDRLDHLARQRWWLERSAVRASTHVVVVMGGADPGDALDGPGPVVLRRDLEVPTGTPLPLAAARNVGVAAARSVGADPIVLLDVDLLPMPGTLGAYLDAAHRWPGEVHVGTVRYLAEGVTPRSTAAWATASPDPRDPPPTAGILSRPELLWSLNFALRPGTWDAIGGFHEGYRGWGAEDTDLGMAAHAAGRSLRWCVGARGLHQWHPPGAGHDPIGDIVRNARTFHGRWGWWPSCDRLRELERRGSVTFDPRAGVLEVT